MRRLYSLWLLILPLILGFSVGMLADAGLDYGLDVLAGDNGVSDVAVTGTRLEENSSNERRSLEGFLASNPFKISPRPSDSPAPPPPPPKVEEPPKVPDTTLDDIVLRGTLPGVGAWFDVKNELKLILVGREIESYKLIAVNYGDAMFKRGDGDPVKKYIVYGPSQTTPKPEAPSHPSRPAPQTPAPPPPPKQTGNIVAATQDSEGQVPSELVSNLVQNPFDEMKRIRIRPNEKAGGLEVQWIQNDSLLKRLGVQRGDIIRSVNGVPFTDMGSIMNSINSLMTSERFDVEVTRGGENTALRYVVK
ncbi:MAG: hypothetical protein IJQ24_01650 [Synergistaceae bacterium]|nr:hypothetical protein [Synergistaceae bacterium]MBR0184713.1 hypothetical protein [Synergistaceae bacterium]